MKHRCVVLTLSYFWALVSAHSAEPAFFAMDTGTRDAKHKTPEEQAALVQEIGFSGIAPIYQKPEMLRDTLSALDQRKLKMFAVYVPLNLDSPEPVSPAIRDTIQQLRGRDSILWIHVNFRAHKPSDPAGDARAVPVMREVADLAKEAGVRVSLYPHKSNWVERVEDGARLARLVGRENFGVTFNLCHWLMVDGADLDARLRDALPHLMMVTINGADANTAELPRVIQPLDSGNFDVAQVLTKLAELGWHGPIGLQHFGIGGDAKVNLQRSMTAWREMSRKVWPASGAKSQLVTRLKAGKKQVVVTYGTSLTAQGAWVAEMADALNKKFPAQTTVINSGKGGQWSQWGVANLDERVLRKTPDTVFIEFSINDSVARFKGSVAIAKANLVTMIDAILKTNSQCEIILMTMTPGNAHPEGHESYRKDIEAHYEMYRTVAKERKLLLIDHYTNWKALQTKDEKLFQKFVPDSIHPTKEGCAKVITPVILTALGIDTNSK